MFLVFIEEYDEKGRSKMWQGKSIADIQEHEILAHNESLSTHLDIATERIV